MVGSAAPKSGPKRLAARVSGTLLLAPLCGEANMGAHGCVNESNRTTAGGGPARLMNTGPCGNTAGIAASAPSHSEMRRGVSCAGGKPLGVGVDCSTSPSASLRTKFVSCAAVPAGPVLKLDGCGALSDSVKFD